MTDKKNGSTPKSEAARPAASLFTPLGREALMSLPPLRWLVKGLLPAQGLVVVYGPSGAGKSFLLLDLALALARGTPWFGRRTLPAQVYYLCLEGLPGFRNRVRAWEQHNGCRLPSDFNVVAQPFNLRDEVDVGQLLLATTRARLRAERTRARDLALPSGVSEEGTSAEQVRNSPVPQVFVVDTLNRAMAGAEENGSSDMSAALAGAFLLAERSGGLVILVHHTGKDVDRGPRGHSSLVPAADASVLVTRRGTKRLWEAQKVKDGADGLVGEFSLLVEGLGEDEDGEAVTSCVVKPESVMAVTDHAEPLPEGLKAGLEALRRCLEGQRPMSSRPPVSRLPPMRSDGAVAERRTEAIEEFAGQTDLCIDTDAWRALYMEACPAESLSGKRNAFLRAQKGLLQRGWIELEGTTLRITEMGRDAMHKEAVQ